MTKIILINGKKRSGKDYTADLIREQLENSGFTCAIMSFATPIKEIIATTFGISLELLDEYKNNQETLYLTHEQSQYEYEQITDFRTILQNFGTEAMKAVFGEEVWVELLVKKAKASQVDFVLVPDFRFLSENIGSQTIKVINLDIADEGDTHRSENELNEFDFDYIIDNTGQPFLEPQVQFVVAEILKATGDFLIP